MLKANGEWQKAIEVKVTVNVKVKAIKDIGYRDWDFVKQLKIKNE